jgi:glucose/arabinose dehydrogenase
MVTSSTRQIGIFRVMRRTLMALCLLAAAVLAALAIGNSEIGQRVRAQGDAVFPTSAPPDSRGYEWALVSDGFDRPIYMTHAGDGTGRLFGVEQTGMIWAVEDGLQSDQPFLDLSRQIPPAVLRGGYSEQGLLGLAFHPDFEQNGIFFVHYTDMAGDTVVARYSVSADNPNVADVASAETILTIDQPFENHNGGQLSFGSDGYLYLGFGDGGSQGDPDQNAQNPAALLGKILRIDINGDTPYAIPADNPYASDSTFAPEVWLMGFRNPWRFSFDRATDDLYIADVGESQWEEVNFFANGDTPGANFGWEQYEATHPRYDDASADYIMPFTEYTHEFGCSVTGGYVYRGVALQELEGYYIFGDYCVGNIWASYRDEAGEWQTTLWMQTARQISSFGEDEVGELYLVDYKGEILRLEQAG